MDKIIASKLNYCNMIIAGFFEMNLNTLEHNQYYHAQC